MIPRTQQEIEEKLAELWPSAETRKVDLVRPERVLFTIASMYSAPGLNFRQLMALSEFFGTQQIDNAGSFADGGCETCDYGSSYGWTMEVRP